MITKIPLYAHNCKGHHGTHHGYILYVSHEGTQEVAHPPRVGEKRRTLLERNLTSNTDKVHGLCKKFKYLQETILQSKWSISKMHM
jgi:hypothetical protein